MVSVSQGKRASKVNLHIPWFWADNSTSSFSLADDYDSFECEADEKLRRCHGQDQ